MKNRKLAVILAIALGGFGAHKFYLGKNLWGIIYLLFCWTGIPTIISLIEGILF
jgi:TM2 domain-containing membrane protein YozV